MGRAAGELGRREAGDQIPQRDDGGDERNGGRSELFDRWHRSMRTTASALLARARQAGDVRPDLDVAELLALANGIALAAPDPAQAARLLLLVREGTHAEL